MEVNTVVISLDRLKELELAEKKVNEPRSKTIVVERDMMFFYIVKTDDESTEKLANDLKDAKEKIAKLKDELNTINIKYSSLAWKLKEMNYWSFRKWKRS